jgi:hypothetical protein
MFSLCFAASSWSGSLSDSSRVCSICLSTTLRRSFHLGCVPLPRSHVSLPPCTFPTGPLLWDSLECSSCGTGSVPWCRPPPTREITALDAVWELDLDSWDLAVWIQVFELLGDVRNGSVDSAVAALDVLPFEASRINRLLNELLGGLFACLWR